MFAMEKALVAIVFCYGVGFGLLSAQFVYADVFSITITSPLNGLPLKTCLINGCGTVPKAIDMTQLNTIQSNVTNTSRASVVTNINSFLGMVWEMILLLTGTYVFYILFLLGVSGPILVGMVAIYFIMLIRAYFGYIRGI